MQVTEEILFKLAKTAVEKSGCRNLVMAGGVALNSVANGKLLTQGIVDNIWVQPAAGDAGGSLGAALAAWHIYFDQKRTPNPNPDSMQGAYLGPEYSSIEIEQMIRKYQANFDKFENKIMNVIEINNVTRGFLRSQIHHVVIIFKVIFMI